jgi:CheY-like chemotaxis protein
VILVEDNVVNAKVLTKQLEKAGCEVHVANHGMECLDLIQKTKAWMNNDKSEGIDPDIICMDLEMPIMDGLTGKIILVAVFS